MCRVLVSERVPYSKSTANSIYGQKMHKLPSFHSFVPWASLLKLLFLYDPKVGRGLRFITAVESCKRALVVSIWS
jgi:hypothetical protein